MVKTVNHVTGEVTTRHVSTRATKAEKEPDWIKLYVNDVARLEGLSSSVFHVLLSIVCDMDYKEVVSITHGAKERIASAHGISVKTVNNAIYDLLRSGLLKRVAKGDYQVDNRYFARGKWSDILDRRAAFALKLAYSPDSNERTVTLEVDNGTA